MKQYNRSLNDLIDELHRNAPRFKALYLIVMFENETKVIQSTDPAALKTLKAFVKEGGIPVGMFGATRTASGGCQLCAWLLEEYKADTAIDNYLASYVKAIAKDLGSTVTKSTISIARARPEDN